MSDYIIVTDSAADMSAAMVEELGVAVLPLSFTMEDHVYEMCIRDRFIAHAPNKIFCRS